MSKELKRGYSTGVHTLIAFRLALHTFLATKEKSSASSIKMDNDDLDVTKGCEIVVEVSDALDITISDIPHTPYIYNNLHIYAGDGVGVATKDGLKVPKGYPAINPTPLQAIQKLYNQLIKDKSHKTYMSVSVINGQEIAKQTANAKVGVLGGISILGTTGFVKPVSSSAYIDSIKAELDVIEANSTFVVLTLGNTSYKQAITRYKSEDIVEIGNFVYDAIDEAIKRDLDIVLYIGMAKALKVAQGFKNTHNRFGSIDFEKFAKCLDKDTADAITVKKVVEMFGFEYVQSKVLPKTKEQIKAWFGKDIEIKII